uniref:Uncharacterized protein n=1 Tax=Panstrongylus lignarius TaxID=156445 RepID=A0A224XXQ6_9HEMI
MDQISNLLLSWLIIIILNLFQFTSSSSSSSSSDELSSFFVFFFFFGFLSSSSVSLESARFFFSFFLTFSCLAESSESSGFSVGTDFLDGISGLRCGDSAFFSKISFSFVLSMLVESLRFLSLDFDCETKGEGTFLSLSLLTSGELLSSSEDEGSLFLTSFLQTLSFFSCFSSVFLNGEGVLDRDR